jgi:hypothetical protein
MTREELLENAALDAFGLLDKYEAALYTRSFHHAHVAVQDEILRLQAELVSDESLLSAEAADPSLRQRVLNSVTKAIESENSQLAPLATIGRTRGDIEQERPVVAGRLYGAGVYWRAACFALCASLIVVAYNLTEANNTNNQISAAFLNNLTGVQIESLIGSTVKDFMFDATSERVVLDSNNAADQYRGLVFVREGSKDAFLVVEGLPAATDFRVCVKDAKGGVKTVHNFSGNGRIYGARISLEEVALVNVRWLVTDKAGTTLLASI